MVFLFLIRLLFTEVGLISVRRFPEDLGLKKFPLLGGDGWDSEQLYKIGKEAVVGSYFSNHYTTDSDDPHARVFIAAFKKEYNKEPDGLSAMGYDAAEVLADAMKRAEVFKLRQIFAMPSLKPKTTWPSPEKSTIDDQRNATKSAVVVKVAGDHNSYVTTINP